MEKEVKIIPPKGYVIDKENSTLECIKFKPKKFNICSILSEKYKHSSVFSRAAKLLRTLPAYNAKGEIIARRMLDITEEEAENCDLKKFIGLISQTKGAGDRLIAQNARLIAILATIAKYLPEYGGPLTKEQIEDCNAGLRDENNYHSLLPNLAFDYDIVSRWGHHYQCLSPFLFSTAKQASKFNSDWKILLSLAICNPEVEAAERQRWSPKELEDEESAFYYE